jgi:hypothetical protein
MPDLRTRFQGAERIPTPDLWEEIMSRGLGQSEEDVEGHFIRIQRPDVP